MGMGAQSRVVGAGNVRLDTQDKVRLSCNIKYVLSYWIDVLQ